MNSSKVKAKSVGVMVKILNCLLPGGMKRSIVFRHKAILAICSVPVSTVDLRLKVGFGCYCLGKRWTNGKEKRGERKEPERGLKIGLGRRGRGESGLRGERQPSASYRAMLHTGCRPGEEEHAYISSRKN